MIETNFNCPCGRGPLSIQYDPASGEQEELVKRIQRGAGVTTSKAKLVEQGRTHVALVHWDQPGLHPMLRDLEIIAEP